MIPRSLKLEESERKYKRVLEKRKKLQALSKTRRDGLLQLVEDCLSGKQKMFGGRFAKPARRNKIILDKISSIETNVLDDEIGNNVKMMENGESPVKKYAEAMNSISTCWFEIPNILHNVSDKKMLGQNILKSIDVTINNDTGLPEEIVFDKEKCILFCEFL